MKIGVYVDVHNIYINLQSKYNKKLDYAKMLTYIRGIGTVDHAMAYGIHSLGKAIPFITKLQTVGFETVYQHVRTAQIQRTNQNVQMAVDMITRSKDIDTLVLCSSDINLIPVIISLDIKIIILACNIPKNLQAKSDAIIEIPSSMLEIK